MPHDLYITTVNVDLIIILYFLLQLRENCDNDPCLNNATCVSVNTSYPGVVSLHLIIIIYLFTVYVVQCLP